MRFYARCAREAWRRSWDASNAWPPVLALLVLYGGSRLAGLDLTFLREMSNAPLSDWDRPSLTIRIAEALRAFPRIAIAQVHGYCLGGALGIMNCHDLVYAAEDAFLAS